MQVLLKINIRNALATARVSKLHPAYYLFLEKYCWNTATSSHLCTCCLGCVHGIVTATESTWPAKLKIFAM